MVDPPEIVSAFERQGAVRRKLTAGETLFLTGDRVVRFYVVERGRLRLMRHLADGTRLSLATAAAGETFAEASLFSERYHCDGVAETPAIVLGMSRARLLAGPDGRGRQASLLLEHFAHQIQSLRRQLELINIGPAGDRVLAYVRGRAGDGANRVDIGQTWKSVASEIGLTHEAVYRALARLQRDGAIEREGGSVILLQPDEFR